MEDGGTWLGCLGGVAFVIAIFGWAWYSANKKTKKEEQARDQAKATYEGALERIKLNPTDPNLRQQALELGRQYAKLPGPEITEMMLKNDIDAACAGVSARRPFSAAAEIKKLTELLEEGILTQDEWQSAKTQLVGVKSNQVDDAVKLLRALHQLVTLGGLTEGEYNMKKWEILSQKLISPDRIPTVPPKMTEKT